MVVVPGAGCSLMPAAGLLVVPCGAGGASFILPEFFFIFKISIIYYRGLQGPWD